MKIKHCHKCAVATLITTFVIFPGKILAVPSSSSSSSSSQHIDPRAKNFAKMNLKVTLEQVDDITALVMSKNESDPKLFSLQAIREDIETLRNSMSDVGATPLSRAMLSSKWKQGNIVEFNKKLSELQKIITHPPRRQAKRQQHHVMDDGFEDYSHLLGNHSGESQESSDLSVDPDVMLAQLHSIVELWKNPPQDVLVPYDPSVLEWEKVRENLLPHVEPVLTQGLVKLYDQLKSHQKMEHPHINEGETTFPLHLAVEAAVAEAINVSDDELDKKLTGNSKDEEKNSQLDLHRRIAPKDELKNERDPLKISWLKRRRVFFDRLLEMMAQGKVFGDDIKKTRAMLHFRHEDKDNVIPSPDLQRFFDQWRADPNLAFEVAQAKHHHEVSEIKAECESVKGQPLSDAPSSLHELLHLRAVLLKEAAEKAKAAQEAEEAKATARDREEGRRKWLDRLSKTKDEQK